MNLTRWTSPKGSLQSPSEYQHRPLRSKTGIRLARVRHGSGSKGISIDLIEAYAPGAGQQSHQTYDALSYTWGHSPRSKAIWCNDRRLFVTQTLLEALQHFRHPTKDIVLWIDQICICQDRLQERTQQVQMMGKIFQGAKKVSVWLGPHYDDSRAGLQLARQLLVLARQQTIRSLDPSQFEFYGLPKRGHRRWKALAAILRRAWFWRTWVIQEVVLNPNVQFALGDGLLIWEELETIVEVLEGPMALDWHFDMAVSTEELPFCRINRIRKRHQLSTGLGADVSPATSEQDPSGTSALLATDLQDEDFNAELNLLNLLLMTRDLGATDPHDKVYALLGLGKHEMVPDYESRPETVFNDFALTIVGDVFRKMPQNPGEVGIRNEATEVRNLLMLLACAGKQNQRLQLHSWTPDWSTNLTSRPLMFHQGSRAGGDILEKVDWSHDTGLQLCGKLIDTIGVAGSILLTCESRHADVSEWWQEAVEVAHSRTAISPGSTANVDAFDALRKALGLCKHGYYRGMHRRASLLDESDIQGSEVSVQHNVHQTMILGPTRGRVMISTTTGFLGLAPHGSEEGDMIFVVLGVHVPFVLRPLSDGTFHLIGEAYMQGIMHGEALSMGFAMDFHDVYLR